MSTHPQDTASGPGPFASGFTLGVLAGAIGYYLFATERGVKLRKVLLQEWEGARHDLAEKGAISNSSVTFRQFLSEMLENISAMNQQGSVVRSQDIVDHTTKKNPRSAPRVKRETSRKFRGV